MMYKLKRCFWSTHSFPFFFEHAVLVNMHIFAMVA